MAGTIIALTGKGGSGKTTTASILLRQLVKLGKKPVLAVDADPNSTLALTLGVEIEGTIADLREKMGQAAQKVSEIPKHRLIDQWLAELLTECTGFDLLTMGRPEGPKCYCYVNSLLRRYLTELSHSYAAVIVDCEAGMEHLSRLTVDDVDTLVLVAEATPIGLTTAKRIASLTDTLPIKVKQRVLVQNKLSQPGNDNNATNGFQFPEMDAVIQVPYDQELYSRCTKGLPIDEKIDGAAFSALEELARICVEPTNINVK